MKKVSVNLPQGDWGTIKTKYPKNSDKVKFTEFTGTSKNFDTDISGVITKRFGGINYNASTLSTAAVDLYEAIFSDGTHHMLTMNSGTLSYSAGGGIMNTVTAGYSSVGNMEFALYQNRVYFGNGIDNPQSYDTTTTYGGVTYTAPKTKQMGALVPSSAPTAALVVDSTANQVPAGAHTYKVTYLYYGSEESNGSTASSVVTADATHTQVTVTIPVGGYGVSARKIYRDNNDGNFLLLATVSDNTTTTYADKLATGTTAIPTDNGLPPTFSKAVQHLDRIWCAGVSASTSTLYYSQPGLPDCFSATGFILCNPRDPIVALSVYNNRVLVFNRNSIGQIIGRTSDTFAYAEIPSAIGCCDNRSVQVRTATGVPTIMWLSDKGFYEFNGSSINYVSDPIEDQVNLNIQQASQVKGKNAQDTQSDFTAGTSTPGISITVGGLITQNNPKKVFQAKADWDAGSSLTNIDTVNDLNSIQGVTQLAGDFSTGTLSSAIVSGSAITLNTSTDSTGENTGFNSYQPTNSPSNIHGPRRAAQSFIPTRSGTITNISVRCQSKLSQTRTWYVKVWSDAGDAPNSELASTSFTVGASGSFVVQDPSVSITLAVTAGTKYWLGVQTSGTPDDENFRPGLGSGNWSTGENYKIDGGPTAGTGFNNLWEFAEATTSSAQLGPLGGTYTLVAAPIAATGQWTSPTKDTGASTISTSLTLTHTATYPTSTSAISYIEGSSDGTTFDVSYSTANQNGAVTQTVASRRYWRIRLVLSTSDNRHVPSLDTPTLTFGTTATWISAAIDHTTDITALNSLSVVSSVPTNTSVTVTLATSSDNVTYSSYTAVGSATAARYSKIKVVITTDTSNTVTASVSNVTLTWTVVSSLTSSAIDTSNAPVGWELFQSTYSTAGTVTFQVRTATTSGGLSAAGWVTATNGAYITNTVNRWIQWKTTITSTADMIAYVDSVTINWFIKLVNSIRVASLFYNRAYFLAAAEYGNVTNNLVFKMDEFGKWRVYRGISVGAISFFFNEPYYASSTSGQIVKWLTGATDQGTSIALDVQTAAINYEDQEHNKILRKVRIIGKNTGATYTPQYSVDNGLTWKSMVNPITGLTTFTTTSDGGLFDIRMQPIFASDNATGITHVFRITNSDAFLCEIHAIKFEGWIRQGEI